MMSSKLSPCRLDFDYQYFWQVFYLYKILINLHLEPKFYYLLIVNKLIQKINLPFIYFIKVNFSTTKIKYHLNH